MASADDDKDKDETARALAARRGTPFLNTEQAAAYLGISARKLQYMRSRCTGPRYRLHSRFVRYHIDDLIFWSRSTSPKVETPEPARKDRVRGGASAAPSSAKARRKPGKKVRNRGADTVPEDAERGDG